MGIGKELQILEQHKNRDWVVVALQALDELEFDPAGYEGEWVEDDGCGTNLAQQAARVRQRFRNLDSKAGPHQSVYEFLQRVATVVANQHQVRARVNGGCLSHDPSMRPNSRLQRGGVGAVDTPCLGWSS